MASADRARFWRGKGWGNAAETYGRYISRTFPCETTISCIFGALKLP